MTKVTIKSNGQIMEGKKKIGIIPDFKKRDFSKYPNMAKSFRVTLDNGDVKSITYGGFKNGRFFESCHAKCNLSKRKHNCTSYNDPMADCQYALENVGFYIF